MDDGSRWVGRTGAQGRPRESTPAATVRLTPERVVAAIRGDVLLLGDAFNRCPGTLDRARQLGISGWAFQVAGWAGPLGEVATATVAAALGFLHPQAVAEGWEAAVRVVPPAQAAEASLAECRRWGEERLATLPGVDRLAALLDRVLAAADPTGMPLFAAWRAVPVPRGGAAGARAARGLRLLREHLLGASLIAVRVSGLTPLEALLAGREGQAAAIACGWLPPYPPVGPVLRRRLWADAATERLLSPALGALDPAEAGELVALLAAARRQVAERG